MSLKFLKRPLFGGFLLSVPAAGDVTLEHVGVEGMCESNRYQCISSVPFLVHELWLRMF